MATINLGAIKFNWKGAYNSSTAYSIDDVVSSGGNSYVCIQASTGNAVGNATAYWNIMSSAGTNGTDGSDGTDISTTLTTQSDLLYRDGSGLQRLPKGSANQLLRINSGATAPEWHTPATVSAGVIQTCRYSTGAQWTQSISGTSFTQINNGATDFDVTITPSSTSHSILLSGQMNIQMHNSANNYAGALRVSRQISGGATDDNFAVGNQYASNLRSMLWVSTGVLGYENGVSWGIVDKSHNTTSAITYKLQLVAHDNHTIGFNRRYNNGSGSKGYHATGYSNIMAQELGHTVTDA